MAVKKQHPHHEAGCTQAQEQHAKAANEGADVRSQSHESETEGSGVKVLKKEGFHTGVDSRGPQKFFQAQELIVFGHTIGAAG